MGVVDGPGPDEVDVGGDRTVSEGQEHGRMSRGTGPLHVVVEIQGRTPRGLGADPTEPSMVGVSPETPQSRPPVTLPLRVPKLLPCPSVLPLP